MRVRAAPGGRLVVGAARVIAVVIAVVLAGAAAPAAERLDYRVVASYPHDTRAFTQGLVIAGGRLFESIGGYGESALREVAPETGEVLRERRLPRRVFAEGLAWHAGRLIQLTWRAGVGIVYDADTFDALTEFRYAGEGWGLTGDGERLIMSDGGSELRFLDPHTFEETGRLAVHDGGRPVAMLNELEYIDGQVYANVWLRDVVARIDPDTGEVTAWIDLTGLLPSVFLRREQDVLNGIAYDSESGRIFVTGKRWPQLYEIELVGEQP